MTGPSRRVVAIIQARLGSTRLPGKSLAAIAGKPLLAHVVERMMACATVHDVVVATTQDPSDAAVAHAAETFGAAVYRGSVDDVLDRYYQAARGARADVVVRATADDPFKDTEVTDQVVQRLLGDGADYASNTLEPTYPEGVDIEAFTLGALSRAWQEATLASEREHVTPYMWKHPELFRLSSVTRRPDLSRLRWTVDYPEDLTFARAIYQALYRGRPFGMQEVLDVLEEQPELAKLMHLGIERNEGYQRSLAQDRMLSGDH